MAEHKFNLSMQQISYASVPESKAIEAIVY